MKKHWRLSIDSSSRVVRTLKANFRQIFLVLVLMLQIFVKHLGVLMMEWIGMIWNWIEMNASD